MNNYSYRIVYPFSKSIFIEKLKSNTILSNPTNLIERAYSEEANNRVFIRGFLNLNQGRFQVYTYPDMYDSFLTPYLFLKRVFILMAPTCIYCHIVGDEEKTIVDYTISKTDIVKVTAIFGIILSSFIGLCCIISILKNEINVGILITLAMIAQFSLMIYMMLKIPCSESDALRKFMRNLGNENDVL